MKMIPALQNMQTPSEYDSVFIDMEFGGEWE
jgi:hypothetical protein